MKKYIALIILVIIAGAIPLILQYGVYLHNTDFAKQQIPFIMETKRMLGSGMPFWSWNTYFGDDFWSSYGFYSLTSPFVWINCLFSYKYMLWGIFFTLILKYICAFLTSSLYFRKMGITSDYAMIGGLFYAFSSYTISNTFYYHFFEPLIVFPLLLIAIERYIRKENYCNTGLIATAFLVTFINYYFAIGSFLISGVYILCRIFFTEDKLSFKRFCIGIGNILIGILASSFILIPTALHLMGGPRLGIQTGLDSTAIPFFLERLRVLFMPQVIEQPTTLFDHTGWNSNSVCLPMIGMFFAIWYFWNYRKDWITILLILLLIIYLTPINSAFTAFTCPSYTRWAYALCLFLILASLKMMEQFKGVHLGEKWILYVLAVLIFFALDLFFNPNTRTIDNENKVLLIAGYVLLFFVNMICLVVYLVKKNKKVLVSFIAICAVCQISLFHYFRSDWYFDKVDDKGKKASIETYLLGCPLKRLSGDMLFRTEFGARYDNLAMLKNRPSISSSHSVQNNIIRKLICTTDTNNELARISFRPNCNWRSFYALMSVKEFIDFKDSLKEDIKPHLNLELKEETAQYDMYENKDYIPMGFTYDSFIDEAIIDSLNQFRPKRDVPLQILANLAVHTEDRKVFEKYLNEGTINEDANLDTIIVKRKSVCCSEFVGTTTGFISKINLPKDNFVVYSVPADKGFTAYVDGEETPIYNVNLGLSSVLVPKGNHSVVFKFIPNGLKEGILLSVLMMGLFCFVFLFEKSILQS